MEDVPRTDVSSVVGMLAASVQGIIEAALRALSSQRLRHPACSTSSTALKYIGLYMKANNPDNTPYQAAKYKAKLEGFLDECGLAPFISSHAVAGSGIAAVRQGKAKAAPNTDEVKEKAARFQQLCGETPEELSARYLR